ncbi:hypothetical protein TTHERM_01311250 (macronuclear) [Tetrahymena thermophila SB210]|uniref:Transmembrane protein n=1 Tax=Tetrahymena thermophila (strain SB210) TaxID=312017 RepID=Q24F82_TETTS|nr:hypothetical protein TTHERM_01311250 [Tetrahymena thermophila SB210]EAS06442.1 hypothetical protein TTHERM_01311250 [Tetrahymena thermophila SB210]|eukprot:XP_001026687.1 hypothetical protein TTHERM_01311250 [Tetrahymena thermophila SB210]
MKKNLIILVFTCAILISLTECQKQLRQGKMQHSNEVGQSLANSPEVSDNEPFQEFAQKQIKMFRILFTEDMKSCFQQCTDQFNNVYFLYNYGYYGCCQFDLGSEMMGGKYQPINCGLQTIYC